MFVYCYTEGFLVWKQIQSQPKGIIRIFLAKSSKLFKKSYVLTYSLIWLCRKDVKVNQRSLFVPSWYYSTTQCYISSFNAVDPFVQESRFLKIFLKYICMAIMLIMWPGPFEQIRVLSCPGRSTWNVVTSGPVVCWKVVEIIILWECYVPLWVQVERMILTSCTH